MHSRFHESKGFTLTVYGGEEQVFSTERLGQNYSYEAADVQRCITDGLIEKDKLPLLFSLELMGILDEIRKQIGVVYPED